MSDVLEIRKQLKVTKIIYLAIMTGIVIFFVVALVLIRVNEIGNSEELNRVFIFVVPIYGLVMMYVSRLVYSQLLSKFDRNSELLKNLVNYRTAKIIAWAIVESACLLSLIAAILTSDYIYIIVFIFLFGYLIMLRPTNESFVRDFGLNSGERDIILKD